MRRISIVGSAGVPAEYGGFETLAQNLVLYRESHDLAVDLTVFCSGRAMNNGGRWTFHGARLSYVPLPANGASSVAYDAWSLGIAVWRRVDAILLLGVSGAIVLPLVRCLGRIQIVTNIDGIEWRRAKWGWLARNFLRLSEWFAVRCSHVVIADNQGIADYVTRQYGVPCKVIAYGGDHAVKVNSAPYPSQLPERYALSLCRIEPENNVAMILEAFARSSVVPLVFVGNWNASAFGLQMRSLYQQHKHLFLLDPEYDLGVLKTLREGACVYVHGHSAGGTNPSLVEMMHFGVPVIAFDCEFNRHTTHGEALYFRDTAELGTLVSEVVCGARSEVGVRMLKIAQVHYTWEQIGAEYFRLFAN